MHLLCTVCVKHWIPSIMSSNFCACVHVLKPQHRCEKKKMHLPICKFWVLNPETTTSEVQLVTTWLFADKFVDFTYKFCDLEQPGGGRKMTILINSAINSNIKEKVSRSC